MREVAEPLEGQFVAVWEAGGALWSSTYKWRDAGYTDFLEGSKFYVAS